MGNSGFPAVQPVAVVESHYSRCFKCHWAPEEPEEFVKNADWEALLQELNHNLRQGQGTCSFKNPFVSQIQGRTSLAGMP